MERRNFLQGIFGGVVGTGLLLKASPSDIEQFAAPMKIGEPLVTNVPNTMAPVLGDFVYNHKGQIIGAISKLDMGFESVEITKMGHTNKQFVRGMPKVTITVQGLSSVDYSGFFNDKR